MKTLILVPGAGWFAGLFTASVLAWAEPAGAEPAAVPAQTPAWAEVAARTRELVQRTQDQSTLLQARLGQRQRQLSAVYTRFDLDDAEARRLQEEIVELQRQLLANHHRLQVELRSLVSRDHFETLRLRVERMVSPVDPPPTRPATPAAPPVRPSARPAPERDVPARSLPNIVLFLVDDLGLMDTSVPFLTDRAGRPQRHPLNGFYRTPHLERLASRGIRFNQFYAMSVCSPTRISILTGQNAARHRTTNWINPDQNNAGPNAPPDWNWEGLKPGDVTLAGLLREGGYRTIHVGKAHFGPRHTPGSDPRNLGFDVNVAGASFGAPGSYYGTENFGLGGPRAHHAVPHLEAYHGSEIFLTEALTREAVRLVRTAVADRQPFFLHFSHYAVHSPFQSDPRFAANYRDSGKPAAAQAFATLVEGVDRSLGDLLDQLEHLGIAENTLILFLGDNGGDAPLGGPHEVASAAPLRGKKGSHYEGGIRVPFLAAWASPNPDHPQQQRLPIPAGAIQTQVASVEDLFPTILALAGVRPPPDHAVDGGRLQTLLAGRPDPARRQSFLMHYPHAPHRSDHWTSYRDGAWKVVYHYFPSPASDDASYQLFNLEEDPFEQTNLAASHPAGLRRLMRALIHELERLGALYPLDPDAGTPRKPVLP